MVRRVIFWREKLMIVGNNVVILHKWKEHFSRM